MLGVGRASVCRMLGRKAARGRVIQRVVGPRNQMNSHIGGGFAFFHRFPDRRFD